MKIQKDKHLEKNDGCDPHHQFIPINHTLLASNTFRNKFMTKKRFRTYIWLRRFVVRGELKASPVNVYNLYYMKGKLATSYPLSRITKDLNISKATAGDHINQLANDGVLVVEEIPPDETNDKRALRVYILGAHSNGKESWFIDNVFGPGT